MIETARLRLRPWDERDGNAFHALFNTPGMMHHLGGVASRTSVDLLLDKRLTDQTRDGMSYWATELREDCALVGSCGLRRAHNYSDTPVYDWVEAGWRIGDVWWRQGFGGGAMGAALQWGWAHVFDRQIATWTTADNLPSLALMRRLAFQRPPECDFVRSDSGEQRHVHLIRRPARTVA